MKGWRSVRKISPTLLSFVTCQYSSPALPFFSLPRPWTIYHMDGKSETHWVGWTIAWGCLTADKDTSIWRTVHGRCRKWPAGAFAVYVVKVGKLTRSAFCMDCRPGRPCTRLIVPLFVEDEIEGAHLHSKRELAFFVRFIIAPFLNRDIHVASVSN